MGIFCSALPKPNSGHNSIFFFALKMNTCDENSLKAHLLMDFTTNVKHSVVKNVASIILDHFVVLADRRVDSKDGGPAIVQIVWETWNFPTYQVNPSTTERGLLSPQD